MKIAYRSASKVRRQTSLLSRLYSATVRAAMTLVCLAETTGVSHVLLVIMAAAVAVILAPVAGLLLVAREIYPWIVHQAAQMTREEGDEEPICVEKRSSIRVALDSGRDPGVMTAVVVAAGPASVATVRRRVAEWVLSGDRHVLKRVLCTQFGCYVWRACRDFDCHQHVLQGPPETTVASLPHVTTELCSQPLQRHLPPWQVVVVPFVHRSDGHALIFRFHHLLTRHFRTAGIAHISGGAPTPAATPSLTPPTTMPFRPPISWAVQCREIARTLHLMINLPLEVLRELLCPPIVAWPWPIPREGKGHQAVAWSEAVPLALIDKIKLQVGATAQDVLLTCICGALRNYITMAAGTIPDDVLGILPVTPRLPPLEGEEKPLGFRTLILPLGEADPLTRLARLQRRLLAAKKHPWKLRTSVVIVQYLSRVLPSPVARLLVEVATRNCFVLVNSEDCADRVLHLKYPPANIGLSLTVVRYSNAVALTAVACLNTIQRPDILVSCFVRVVHDLALALDIRQDRRPLSGLRG